MNRKGFTLIELLATIVIMALILIMVMPSITALRNNSEKRQYEYYGDSLIAAAKIFVNKEGEDITSLGTLNFIGCVDITYQELIDADLIEPFTKENIDCSNALIRYTKERKKDISSEASLRYILTQPAKVNLGYHSRQGLQPAFVSLYQFIHHLGHRLDAFSLQQRGNLAYLQFSFIQVAFKDASFGTSLSQ